MHDQLHPPPLASAVRFQIRYAHPMSLDCHQLYIVIVAKPCAWLQKPSQSAFLRSVMIFVKSREVSTCTILPNFINLSVETALYSCFGGHNRGVVKGGRGSVRLQFDYPGQPRRFSRATKKVLACSHSRSLQLLQGVPQTGQTPPLLVW